MAEMRIDLAGVQYYRIESRTGWFFDAVGYPNGSRLGWSIISLNTALDLIESQQAHITRQESLVARMREALRDEHSLAQGYYHRFGTLIKSSAHKFLPDQYDGAE